MRSALSKHLRTRAVVAPAALLILIAAVAIGATLARGASSDGVQSDRTTSRISFRVDRQVEVGRQQYMLRVASGVVPRMRPADVQAVVLTRIGPNGRIDAMSALASRSDASSVEKGAGVPLGPEADLGPVWVVRGYGRFVGRHTPPGVPEPVANTGYYMIDDNTGDVLGMGLP